MSIFSSQGMLISTRRLGCPEIGLLFKTNRGFPGGSLVKNPPAAGFDPWSGEMPHAEEQWSHVPQLLSLCSST